MSAVETGQMSAAETGQMSAVETRQRYSIKIGQRPVATVDICLVSMADICPVSAADIPVSTNDMWVLWGHLGKVENDFDPFFTPKMFKMELDQEHDRRGPAPTGGAPGYGVKRPQADPPHPRAKARMTAVKQTPSNHISPLRVSSDPCLPMSSQIHVKRDPCRAVPSWSCVCCPGTPSQRNP